jgi:hypothetical protein
MANLVGKLNAATLRHRNEGSVNTGAFSRSGEKIPAIFSAREVSPHRVDYIGDFSPFAVPRLPVRRRVLPIGQRNKRGSPPT